jgi:hypothetical protein
LIAFYLPETPGVCGLGVSFVACKQGRADYLPMKGLRMLGGLATVLILACATTVPEVNAEPVEFTLERRFENKKPEYKALRDPERITVLSRWATEQGGFDGELLALATAIALRGDARALVSSRPPQRPIRGF